MNKEIIDPEGMIKVIAALFGKLPVYMVVGARETPIKIIALKNKALVISNNTPIANKSRILTLVHNGSRFVSQFTLVGGDGQGIEILQPLKITIVPATRQGARVDLAKSGGSSLTVTNLINVLDVSKAIGFDDKKVDAVLLNFRTKLSKIFPYSSIYLTSRADNRLRLMQHYEKPIYIVDRKNKSTANPMYLPFDEYLRIFETSKLPDELISEICVPIRYKGYISVGYVQILSHKSFEPEVFDQMSMFSGTFAKEIIATGVFQESKEQCSVVDLSAGGISFIHAPTRAFSRNVTMNGAIIFDLILGPNEKATFRSIIKNIRNQETNYRVGCQFYNPTEEDTRILEEFLGKNSGKESGNGNHPDEEAKEDSPPQKDVSEIHTTQEEKEISESSEE